MLSRSASMVLTTSQTGERVWRNLAPTSRWNDVSPVYIAWASASDQSIGLAGSRVCMKGSKE